MRIQDVAGKEAPFHVPSSQGKSLIAHGTHVEVLPTCGPGQLVEFLPNMTFRVMQAAFNSEPWIAYSCTGCGMQKGVIMGAEAHLKRIWHCGISDPVPQDVARQYVAILNDRKEARERQQQPSVAKNQPAFSLDRF